MGLARVPRKRNCIAKLPRMHSCEPHEIPRWLTLPAPISLAVTTATNPHCQRLAEIYGKPGQSLFSVARKRSKKSSMMAYTGRSAFLCFRYGLDLVHRCPNPHVLPSAWVFTALPAVFLQQLLRVAQHDGRPGRLGDSAQQHRGRGEGNSHGIGDGDIERRPIPVRLALHAALARRLGKFAGVRQIGPQETRCETRDNGVVRGRHARDQYQVTARGVPRALLHGVPGKINGGPYEA